jgi:hypothetical protein
MILSSAKILPLMNKLERKLNCLEVGWLPRNVCEKVELEVWRRRSNLAHWDRVTFTRTVRYCKRMGYKSGSM